MCLLLVTAGVGAAVLAPLGQAERSEFDTTEGREALDQREPSGRERGPSDGDGPTDGAGTDADGSDARPADGGEATPSGPHERWARGSDGTTGSTEADLGPEIEDYESVLVLGSDDGVGDELQADVVVLGILREHEDPVLLSLPRDLWVHNPCVDHRTRINEGLQGCGDDVGGLDLMGIMVEDVTGLRVDHAVEIGFDGFGSVIDALGGIEVCNEHPVRDPHVDDDWALPAGCVDVDGDEALGWVRSRRTLQEVDGRWQPKPDVNDLRRNERQREVMLQAMETVTDVGSLRQLRALADGVAGSLRLSDSISLTRGSRLVWSARDVEADAIEQVTPRVRDHVTEQGAQVLLLNEDLSETIRREVTDGERLLEAR